MKRPPCPGDVLQRPQRMVEWVDRRTRLFRTLPLWGTPADHHGAENLPLRMRASGFGEAPIEDGWVELPSRGRVPYTLAVPLIVAIYESPGGGCGCCLHVVLDDGNYRSVDWCFEQPDICDRCRQCAAVLLEMSVTARKKAILKAHERLRIRAAAVRAARMPRPF